MAGGCLGGRAWGFWHLSSTDIIERDSFHLGGIRAEEKVFQFALKDEYMGFQERKGLDIGMLPAGGTAWESVWGAEHWSPCISEESGSNEASGWESCLPEVMFSPDLRLRPAMVNNRFRAFGLVSCLPPCIFLCFDLSLRFWPTAPHPAELQSASHLCISSLYSSRLTWYFSKATHERPTLAHVCVLCLFPYSF